MINKELEQRVINLEIKETYLEKTVQTLNDLVIEQTKEIKALESALRQMQNRINEIIELQGEVAVTKPPHY